MPKDIDRIEQRVFIKAPPSRVWHALVERSEFETWFHVSLDAPFAIGEVNHMFEPSEPQGCQRFPFEVTEMTPPSRLVWKWHPGRFDPAIDYASAPRTTVTFTLEPHLDGTMITVIEDGFDTIPADRIALVMIDNVNGWLEQAARLKAHFANAA